MNPLTFEQARKKINGYITKSETVIADLENKRHKIPTSAVERLAIVSQARISAYTTALHVVESLEATYGFVLLDSVGCFFNPTTKMTYPALRDNTPDLGGEIHLDDTVDEWRDALSSVDAEVVYGG